MVTPVGLGGEGTGGLGKERGAGMPPRLSRRQRTVLNQAIAAGTRPTLNRGKTSAQLVTAAGSAVIETRGVLTKTGQEYYRHRNEKWKPAPYLM